MQNTKNLWFDEIAATLPAEWQDEQLTGKILQMNQSMKRKIFVLDDDPTGVQTVHDVYVLTSWEKGLLKEVFLHPQHVVFILTNTRAMDVLETERINREIAQNVLEVAKELSYGVQFISRSDSTLRGHYPLEIDILSEETQSITGKSFDAHLIIPAFFEANRYTYKNVHYLKERDRLIPVHETEFAKDKVFGFTHSDLAEWLGEKTNKRYQKEACLSLSIEDIRSGPDEVVSILDKAAGNQPVIVNALSYKDLQVVSMALLILEEKGKRFIYRTAASFVKAYGGISDKNYLSIDQMSASRNEQHGGLVIVGSHTKKTTQQLEALIHGADIFPIEMDVNKVLSNEDQEMEINHLITKVNQLIRSGQNAVVFSSRKLISAKEVFENLRISQRVSDSLVKIVSSLDTTPKFIIAKGGITSSDVATKGLKIKKAMVLGQVAPAIPVWLSGKESKFPNIPYVIFPGNVGDEGILLEIVRKLRNKK